jgi:hypothetical protein
MYSAQGIFQHHVQCNKVGQGKSTYMFSAQHRRISAFRLLALTTEAWRGAESGTLRELYALIYPDLKKVHIILDKIW